MSDSIKAFVKNGLLTKILRLGLVPSLSFDLELLKELVVFALEKSLPLAAKEIDVLTVGEVLIDMIETDGVYQAHFGGSPANIAMNVQALGGRSSLVAAVGKDRLGQFLKDKIDARGVQALIQEKQQSTSMVVVNQSRGTPTPIFYRGADAHIEFTDELEDLLGKSKILHFSCWPISQSQSRKTVEALIAKCREEGIIVSFDPNYHPDIWELGHDGIAYIQQIMQQVDIVKPSEDDAERIFGPDTVENHIQKFLDLGAKLVIMTLGKDGLIVATREKQIAKSTKAKKVVDTTGAGDAFWSGFYTGISQGKTIQEAVDSGLVTSAYKLEFLGAVVDLPSLEELEERAHAKE